MRSFLASSLALVGVFSFATEARADLYGDYLSGLRRQIESFESFGFDANELRQIDATVQGRPQVVSEESYDTYLTMLTDLSERFASFGYDTNELAVLDKVASVNPRADAPVDSARYAKFLGVVSQHIEKSESFGFDAKELRVLDLLVAARPSLAASKSDYEAEYGAWQRTVQRTEERFASFGVDANEALVLGKLRTLQPQLAVAPAREHGHAKGESSSLRLCGRTFRGAPLGGYASRRGLPVVTMLLDGGDLVQIDGEACQVRWLGDGVVSASVHPGHRTNVFVKRGGATFAVRGEDVYEVGSGMTRTDCDADPSRPGPLYVYDRTGVRHVLEPWATAQGAGVRFDGRAQTSRYRYTIRWQPLEAAGPF
jgi:hypothetical protein